MIKSIKKALLASAIAVAGIAGQAQAEPATGTHTMWSQPYKSAPFAVQHENGKCPNMPAKLR